MRSGVFLEVAVSSVEGALVAQSAGADRIELNSALELDGLTPSHGLIAAVRDAVSLPMIVMLRPKPGNFAYSNAEFDIMQRDLDRALKMGADGVALGILTGDGRVDVARCGALMAKTDHFNSNSRSHSREIEAVFHRAFDLTPEPVEALEELIALGFSRVLTSGQAATAIQGARRIKQLVERAAGRIEILAGAGVRAENAAELVRITGCTQIHGSFSKAIEVDMGPLGKTQMRITDREAILRTREALRMTGEAHLG